MEERYNKELKSFGKRLKEIRKSKNLTQLDLEIESGIIQTEITRIERGMRNIEFMTIVKLAEALKVEISDFFPRGN